MAITSITPEIESQLIIAAGRAQCRRDQRGAVMVTTARNLVLDYRPGGGLMAKQKVRCALCGRDFVARKDGLPRGHAGDIECRSPTAEGQRYARETPIWLVFTGAYGSWYRPNSSGYTTHLLAAGLYIRTDVEHLLGPSYRDRFVELQRIDLVWAKHLASLSAAGSVGALLALPERIAVP